MSSKKQFDQQQHDFSREDARTQRARRAEDDRVKVAVPSNTATNNSINTQSIKFLRYGVDSLYLSYQGNLFDHIDQQLSTLKRQAQSQSLDQQAKAQIKLGEHLFEVKDKGNSIFAYVLEDNAFQIKLSRPDKAVPMAYIKISSEYLTYQLPEQAESHLKALLEQLGTIESLARVSRIDLYVDFVSFQNMEAWGREAWVTRASNVNAYAVDQKFSGWTIGAGGVISARLYDKLLEIQSSHKEYLLSLWEAAGHKEGEPVWRLEFQYKRDFLRQKELINLVDVLNHLNGLWSYAMTEWLKLTIPSKQDMTRSRWKIHSLWLVLSSIDWGTNDSPLKSRFKNQRIPNDEAILDRGVSAFTSWMAAHAHDEPDTAFQTFFDVLAYHIHEKARRLDLPTDEMIMQKVAFKARQFNTLDNNIERQDIDEQAEAYRKASDGE